MSAVRIIPKNYTLRFSFDLKRNIRAAALLQLAGLVLFVFFGFLFWKAALVIRPEMGSVTVITISSLWEISALLVSSILAVVLHEAMHGVFFWIFTRQRPQFGLGWGYVYAHAPGWYFPRWSYALIGLAPLIFLTLIGFALLSIVNPFWVFPLLLGMLINASGAVGDLWIVLKVIAEKGAILVEDTGDGFKIYGNSSVV